MSHLPRPGYTYDGISRLYIKFADLCMIYSTITEYYTYNDPTPHKILNPSYILNLLIEFFSLINNTLMKQYSVSWSNDAVPQTLIRLFTN